MIKYHVIYFVFCFILYWFVSWKNERHWGSRYAVDWGEQDWVSWCFVCWSEGGLSPNAHPPLRRTCRVLHRAKTLLALTPDPGHFDARTTKCSMFPRIFELRGIQPLYASYQSYRRSNGSRLRLLYDRVHKMSSSKFHWSQWHLWWIILYHWI